MLPSLTPPFSPNYCLRPPNTVAPVDSAYLGALYSIDDYKVYGHYSNTHIKTILVCDHSLLEISVRSAILELSELYVTAMQSPFQAIGMPIVSKKFTENIQKVMVKSQCAHVTPQTPKKI